jgi:hypothetical protein
MDSVLGTLALQLERLHELKTWLIFAGAILIDMLPLLFGAITARRKALPMVHASTAPAGRYSDMLYRPSMRNHV